MGPNGRRPADNASDGGFGLVEILVSMTLLALIMMALAPVLISSFRMAANNSTIAFATQAVNERVELARAASGSCADFQAFVAIPAPTVFDARGVEIRLEQTPAPAATLTCPGAGVQMFGVIAFSQVTGEQLAEAQTAIAVPRLG